MTGYLAWSSKRISHLISTHSSIMISIVNQIQASITGEATNNLGKYEEIQCDENKIKYIQNKEQAPPSNQAIVMANTKFFPQRCKTRSIKGFGENVSQLSLCVNLFHHYVSLLKMVPQDVVSHIDVFCSPMKHWVFGLGIWHWSYHT
jgi:hypothetical protein